MPAYLVAFMIFIIHRQMSFSFPMSYAMVPMDSFVTIITFRSPIKILGFYYLNVIFAHCNSSLSSCEYLFFSFSVKLVENPIVESSLSLSCISLHQQSIPLIVIFI